MELTNKQLNEIRCLKYFALPFKTYSKPENCKSILIDQKGKYIKIAKSSKGVSAEEAYFLICDQGKKDVAVRSTQRLLQYLDAKKWRLRQIEFYEDANLEGAFPWITIITRENGHKVSRYVMEFIAKTMFKGVDREREV